MASNELVALLELIAEAVWWVMKRTFDLVCIACFLASLVLPWRLLEELCSLDRTFRDSDWQLSCLASLVITLLDCIAVPMCLLSLASPWRWRSVYKYFAYHFGTSSSEDHRWDLRGDMFKHGFYAMFDLFCLPFFAICVALLTRVYFVASELTHVLGKACRGGYTGESQYEEDVYIMNVSFLKNAFLSIIDVIILILTLPFVLGCVHLLVPFIKGIRVIKKDRLDFRQFSSSYDPMRDKHNALMEVYMDIWAVCLFRIPQFFIDVIAAPCALVAVLSPLRSGVYRQACADRAGATWCIASKPAPSGEGEATTESREVYKQNESNQAHFDFFYNFNLRKLSIYYGVIAMTDILLFPFLIPLVLTWYRFKPVREKIASSGKPYGLEEVFMIFFQFMLLTLDLLTAPVLLLLFVTRIRWKPLAEAYANDDMCSLKSLGTYCVMLGQLFLLILDVLVSPLALFVLVTYYRSDSVIYILKCKKRWHEDEFYFHRACLVETLIVFHDVLLMCPLILFLLVSIYRARYVLRKLIEAATYKKPDNAPLASAPPSGMTEVVALEVSSVPMPDEVTVVQPVVEEAQDPDPVSIGSMDVDWREAIWKEFFNFIFDFPFFVMSVIIVATVWRATALWKSLRRVEYDRYVGSWYISISHTESLRYYEYYRNCRREVWYQFCSLLLDFLFLFPFFFVIVTVYRLPSVLIQLFSKAFETMALIITNKNDEGLGSGKLHAPVLQIVNAHWEFPERGGPRITIRAKRTQAASYGATNKGADSLRFASTEVLLHVLGTELWKGVEGVFGSTVAAVGKGMLPLRLKDTVGIGMAPLIKYLSEDVEGAAGEVEFWIELDFKNTKRTSVLKNIKKLYRLDSPVVLQVEADLVDANNQKKREILFAMAPTLGELAQAVEKVSSDLHPNSFNEKAYSTRFLEPLPTLTSEKFFQDSFGPIVLVAASQIVIDLYYIALFLFVMLAPWRFYELMCSLMQSDEQYYYRAARYIIKLKREGDRYLTEFREKFIPVLNNYTKTLVQYEHALTVSYTRLEALRTFEAFTYNRYTAAYAKILKRFKTLDGRGSSLGLDKLEAQLRELVMVQNQRLSVWPFRFVLLSRMNKKIKPQSIAAAAETLLRVDREEASKELVIDAKIESIYADIEKQCSANKKLSLKSWISKPIDDSRWIIKDVARSTLMDYGIVLVFLFLCLSIAPLPSLASDLWKYRNSPSHTAREIVIFHARKFMEAKTKIAKLCLYSVAICLLVVGLPAYIEKLPRCEDIDDCIQLAKDTLRKSCHYLCDFLSLFVLWRTYRLAITAGFYALFVPAACIAEGFPICKDERKFKFTLAIIIWFGILGFSAAATAVSRSSDQVQEIRTCVIVLMSILSVIIMGTSSVVNKAVKRILNGRQQVTERPLTPSWSNIMALVTAPLETIQLGAIVIYFFWVRPGQYDASDASSVHYHAAKLMVWGDSYGGDAGNLRDSLLVAVSIVLFWIVLSSVPLAFGGSDDNRREKIKSMVASPSFNFASAFVSQLFFVWLVATLLRPTSCVHFEGSSDLLVSTGLSSGVLCGGGEDQSWIYKGSLPLLMFFLVTCTMMHSSTDIIDMSPDQSNLYRKVKFNTINDHYDVAPLAQFNQLYSRVVQVMQVCIVVTCFTGLACSEPVVPLFIIAVVSLLNVAVPFLWSEPVCSVNIVPWLRALGSLLVCWTAIVCALHTRLDTYYWATGSALYIGWLVIGVVGLAVVYLMYKRHQALQAKAVDDSGLREAINALLGVTGMLTVGDALTGPTIDEASTWRRGKALEERIRRASSLTDLCDLVLELEYAILIDRLKDEFLHQRQSWITKIHIAKQTPTETLIVLKSAISFLHENISSTSPITHVSRSVLAFTLRWKCPEEIAWHIFSYLFDATEIEKFVKLMLTEVSHGRSPTAELILSHRRYGNDTFLSYFFSGDFRYRISYEDALVRKPKYDNSMFGNNNTTPQPEAASHVEAVQYGYGGASSSSYKPRAKSFDSKPYTSSVQQQIDSDHLLALRLAAEG